MNDLTLQVEGMSCAVCVGKVERALEGLPYVHDPSVNLAGENARLRVDAPEDVARVAEALAQAGYPVVTDTLTLSVAGLNDATAVANVERIAGALPGVLEALVNQATETARVTIAAGAIRPNEVAAAITAGGYTAHVEKGTTADQETRKRAEIDHLRRLTLLAAALALPVFVMEMGGHIFPAFHHWLHGAIGMQTSRLIQFALTSAVMFGPGLRFFRMGVPQLLHGTPDMNSLVAMGTTAAYTYSTLATFVPGLFPEGTANVYFESAAVIIVLILFGRWMEARAKGRTGEAIRALMRLRPKVAIVERDGETREIPTDEIVPGDIVLARPGAAIPTDGVVVDGESHVDESMVTGEPMPVTKTVGAAVIGGTTNTTGALRIEATRVGADTTLAQIIRLVEQAQGGKLPIQSMVDKVTRYFVPSVMSAALLTVAAWLIFAPAPALSLALVAGVSVLVIACPCAMGLATPTSIMVGTGRGAELGVLFRKGDALQSLEGVKVVAFDKTGTLTEGRPHQGQGGGTRHYRRRRPPSGPRQDRPQRPRRAGRGGRARRQDAALCRHRREGRRRHRRGRPDQAGHAQGGRDAARHGAEGRHGDG